MDHEFRINLPPTCPPMIKTYLTNAIATEIQYFLLLCSVYMSCHFVSSTDPTNKDFSSLIDKEISCYIQRRTEEWEYEVEIEDLHLLLPETMQQSVVPETDIEF